MGAVRAGRVRRYIPMATLTRDSREAQHVKSSRVCDGCGRVGGRGELVAPSPSTARVLDVTVHLQETKASQRPPTATQCPERRRARAFAPVCEKELSL